MTSNKPEHMMDELEWLHFKREEAHQRLTQSRQRMEKSYQRLTQPVKQPQSRWGQALMWVGKGMDIYQGVKMGYRIGDAISLCLSLRKLLHRR